MECCGYCKYFESEWLYCWKYGCHVYKDDYCKAFKKNDKKEE